MYPFVFIALLCIQFARAQETQDVKKVAITEVVDKKGDISYGVKLVLRSCLSSAVTNTVGYEGYDRTDISSIMDEQKFQRTGLVSDDEIKRFGEMTGASYILVAEMAQVDENDFFITAKILNVETAKLEKMEYAQSGSDVNQLSKACQRLAEVLLGTRERDDDDPATGKSTFNGRKIDRNPQKGKVVLYYEGLQLVPQRHLPVIVSIDERPLGEGSVSDGFYFEIPNIADGEHKLKFEVKSNVFMGNRSSTITIHPEEARFYEFGMKKTMLRSTEFFSVVLKSTH